MNLLEQLRGQGVQISLGANGKIQVFSELDECQREWIIREKEALVAQLIEAGNVQHVEVNAKLNEWDRFYKAKAGYDWSIKNWETVLRRQELDQCIERYRSALCELKDVHAAFCLYAKAHKRRKTVKALTGSLLEKHHRKDFHYEGVCTSFDQGKLQSVVLKTPTPQTEPDTGSLERLFVTFGINTHTEYEEHR